jgi:hypothetical protein
MDELNDFESVWVARAKSAASINQRMKAVSDWKPLSLPPGFVLQVPDQATEVEDSGNERSGNSEDTLQGDGQEKAIPNEYGEGEDQSGAGNNENNVD